MILLAFKLILWFLTCIYLGKLDGYLYFYRSWAQAVPQFLGQEPSVDPHKIATILRFIVCLGLSLFIDLEHLWVSLGVTMGSCLGYGFMLSFIHNGFYFKTRAKFDPSLGYTFKTDSGKNSTAENDFTYTERLDMFIVGIIISLLPFYLYFSTY